MWGLSYVSRDWKCSQLSSVTGKLKYPDLKNLIYTYTVETDCDKFRLLYKETERSSSATDNKFSRGSIQNPTLYVSGKAITSFDMSLNKYT
jgi:hypothetical protein